jgi:hypothetical protein
MIGLEDKPYILLIEIGTVFLFQGMYGLVKEVIHAFISDSAGADTPMARKEPARAKKVAKRSSRPRKTYAARRDYDGSYRDDFFAPRTRYRDPFSIW